MAVVAREVRITGDRSSEMGQMLMTSIAKFNRNLRARENARRKAKEGMGANQ